LGGSGSRLDSGDLVRLSRCASGRLAFRPSGAEGKLLLINAQ